MSALNNFTLVEVDFAMLGKKARYEIKFTDKDVNSASINIKLKNNGQVIDLTNYVVTINIQVEDFIIEDVCQMIDRVNGEVQYTFPKASLINGLHYFEISLTEKNANWVKVSPKIYYKVYDTIEHIEINENDNFPVLIKLINKVEELNTTTEGLIQDVDNLNTNITNQESIRRQNEQQRIQAESTRQSQESNRVSVEKQRVNQENARQSNENTREQNEVARVIAENNRQNNENNRQTQESNRQSNEKVRETQENSRQQNENSRQSAFNQLKSDLESLRNDMNSFNVQAKADEQVRKSNEINRQNTFTSKVNEVNDKILDIETRMKKFEAIYDNTHTFEITQSADLTNRKENVLYFYTF